MIHAIRVPLTSTDLSSLLCLIALEWTKTHAIVKMHAFGEYLHKHSLNYLKVLKERKQL